MIANGVTSQLREVTCRVPQGSIMGPLLFLVYANDVTGLLDNCEISTYADDTAIFITHRHPATACVNVQKDLHNLSTYCRLNKLTLNPKKTVAQHCFTFSTAD